MEWLKEYWWVIVILLMVGVLMNVYKDLKRIDHKNIWITNRICHRIAISTISGTMTTTGRRRSSRR